MGKKCKGFQGGEKGYEENNIRLYKKHDRQQEDKDGK